MTNVIVQDDIRQRMIATHCGLINSTKRYGPDAFDENNIEFEIKSGTTKNYISTARDFGFNILQEYRKKYWIIASGILDIDNIYNMEELYIAHPDNLNFFLNSVEQILNQHQRVIESIKNVNICLSLQERKIMNKILNRGMTLNDPRIKMKDIRSFCTKIDHIDSVTASQQVKNFILKNPIATHSVVTSNTNYDFFVW